MKQLFFISLILSVFYFSSCDKINNPIVPRADTTDTINDTIIPLVRVYEKNNSKVSNIRKVLLEDYTGQSCPNCPDAAKIAKTLLTQYPTQLVVVAVHAGGFAEPKTTYTNDFRTTAGNTWLTYFAVSGFPTGMINRKKTASSFLFSRSKWAAEVDLQSKDPLKVAMTVNTAYDTLLRTLNVTVKGVFKATYTTDVNVTALIMEAGIIGRQDDKGIEIEDYEFEHVMRGTITNADVWGQRLKTRPIAAEMDSTVSFSNFPIKPTYNDRKLWLVVFSYREDTKEILQSEKIKLR